MAKILIADDDAQVLQVLASMLKTAGHHVLSAQDGKTAFETFQREKPHAVIADVLIPGIAGTGISARVKREAEWCGVILISGVYTDPSFPADATGKYKADAFFTKPFTADQILGALKPLLEKAAANAPAVVEEELMLGDDPAPASPAGGDPGRSPTPEPILGSNEPKQTKLQAVEEASRAAAAVRAAMAAAGMGRSVQPNPPSGASPAAAPAPVAVEPAPVPTPSGPMSSVPPEGSLEKLSVVALLYRCANEKLAGKIVFRKDVAAKEVWVKDGKIAWAASNLETDRLEYKMLQDGRLTADQYKDVAVLAKGMGGVEAALVNLKIVPPGEVFESSRVTAVNLVLEVFKWLGGKFQFQAGAAIPASHPLDINIEDLIGRGLKEAFDLERLQRAFGTRMKSPVGKDLVGIQNVDKLKLQPAEFRLSRMIDGRKTVDAIAKEWAGGDAVKELRGLQVLYLMAEAGMIRLEETAEVKKAGVDLNELKKFLVSLEGQTFFEVLGVTQAASPADAKKAYFNLAKKYHPDTIPVDASPEHRKIIEAIFSIIGRANQVLGDPKQRDTYVKDLAVGGTGASLEAENILQAEIEFQKGEFFLLKKKDIPQAEKHLATALKLNPREAEHHVMWGWLVYSKSKGASAQEAVKHIEAGIKIRDNIPNAYLFLGHILKAKGEIDKAEKFYRKCVSLDEKNTEAMSELRVIAMRKGKK